MRAPDLYLSAILDALAKIEEFTAGMTLEEFARDDRTQSAVIRKFEIVGEASKKVPKDCSADVSRHTLEGNGRYAG